MTILTVKHRSRILFRGSRAEFDTWVGPTPITFLSVCSGIEAASVAWKPLGWRAVGFAEIEKFPSAVLAHHYPNVPNYGDFTKIDTTRVGRVDILCGGTPCQAFSIAGARRSLDDARGNLTLAFVELAHELKPRNVVWENVPGVLSTKDNAFGSFLAGLVDANDAIPPPRGRRWPNAGVVTGPKGRAAWRVLDAQYFGLAQRRKRVIVVADFGNGADPAAVLFESEGVRRDSPPRRETGEGIAPTISAHTKGGGGLGTDFDLDGGLIHAPEIARCVATREGSSLDYETTTMVAQAVALRGREGGGTAELGDDLAHALRASGGGGGGGGDKPHVLAFHHNAQACQLPGPNRDCSVSDSLTCSQNAAVSYASVVRRLTPRECERLQGFQFLVTSDYPGAWQDDTGRWWSPDYTAVPHGHVSKAKLDADFAKYLARGNPKNLTREQIAGLAADGPRYKALGNSWAVPKFKWLGERIQRFMPHA